jgi:anthranilate phosphoribosyltransferase
MSIQIPKTPESAFKVMNNMMKGQFSTDEIVEFLRFFQRHPMSAKFMNSFLAAVKSNASYKIDTSEFTKPIIDIAGTGGDGKHTANISTLTGLFCAATGLVNVAKYGNRAASSLCGSMDVLEAVGIPIDLEMGMVTQYLTRFGFSPMFARSVYPGAKYVAEVRAKLSGPSIFNLLFPLARPITGSPRFVFGVSDLRQVKMIADVYALEENTRCLLVRGADETDEVSTTGSGETEYVLIDSGQIKRGQIDCQKLFDFKPTDLSEIQVTSKEEAVELFIKVCDPQANSSKISAIRQSVMANAAVALFIGLDSKNMNIDGAKKYLAKLEQAFRSGKVLQLIENLQAHKGGSL